MTEAKEKIRTVALAAIAALLSLAAGLSLSLAERSTTAAEPAARSAKSQAAANELQYREQIVPFLKKYCLECHGPELQEGDLAFHKYKDVAAIEADQKTWQKVEEMLASSAMPPDDVEQPTPAERKLILGWIDRTIYHYDCDGPPDPGRVTIRRLNRAEYNNTVRDLLGIQFKPADDFPSDDVGSGFDNIGDVLTLPPLLMEKYLAAAEQIADEVILVELSTLIPTQRRDRRDLRGEGAAKLDSRGRRWDIISRGSVSAEFNFPRAGDYSLQASAYAMQAGDEPARLEMQLDGKTVKVFDVLATRSKSKTYSVNAHVPAGKHRLTAAFPNDFYDAKAKDREKRDRNLTVLALEVSGPTDLQPTDYPEMHRKLIVAQPGKGMSAQAAAEQNLRPFLNRAFRRRATEAEISRLAGLVEQSMAAGDTFEQGMQNAVIATLVSPHFLFRVERDPQPENPQLTHELQQYELATRLSYFLWSSMPDDELFILATNGQLDDGAVLERQVRRMLADKRATALVQNFGTQWLNLRLLDGVAPDPKVFGAGSFSDDLKADMRRETELFFEAIMRDDRSILEFLDGKFTFVNERLAKHYGLKGIRGDDFQRVNLEGESRAGVLTQASILTLTSNPGRTSPVKRGKWIMENFLGSAPPDPPPDVPELEATRKAKPGLSLRKQLEIHRANAVCASCHKTMDQLGFGLENFDAIGRWRDQDGGLKIDSSGLLPGGDKFKGPIELAEVLKRRKLEFAGCLSEKMLTYALGRGLMHYDRCATDKIVEAMQKDDFRFSSLVLAIVNSEPFRRRRGDGGKP
jgi:hypothetical protein